MREPVWVPQVVVAAVHVDQIRAHGGMPGIRDEAALESALARPRNKFAYGRKVDHASLAAGYAYGLARGHPFNDGNKRVAFLVAVIYLGLNGMEFEASDEDVVGQMVALAAGRLSETKLATWFRSGLRKIRSQAPGG